MGNYLWSLIITVFQKWKTSVRPPTGNYIHRKNGSVKEIVQHSLHTVIRQYHGLLICAISNNLE